MRAEIQLVFDILTRNVWSYFFPLVELQVAICEVHDLNNLGMIFIELNLVCILPGC